MRTKTYTEDDVVERQRDGARLIPMNTTTGDGKEWFVVPGGPVPHDVAHAVIRRDDVHGIHDPQWPGIPQVFVYRRAA
jgi:hypothetical protein